MKRKVVLEGVEAQWVIEELDQFFSLDFQARHECVLRYFDGGIKAIERVTYSPLLLVVHLALTLFTAGVWIMVWVLVDTHRYINRRKVQVKLLDGTGDVTAEISGTTEWVNSTEAYIRRNLIGATAAAITATDD